MFSAKCAGSPEVMNVGLVKFVAEEVVCTLGCAKDTVWVLAPLLPGNVGFWGTWPEVGEEVFGGPIKDGFVACQLILCCSFVRLGICK